MRQRDELEPFSSVEGKGGTSQTTRGSRGGVGAGVPAGPGPARRIRGPRSTIRPDLPPSVDPVAPPAPSSSGPVTRRGSPYWAAEAPRSRPINELDDLISEPPWAPWQPFCASLAIARHPPFLS